MDYFIYDGSFEGFLSGVFYAFETKVMPDEFQSEDKFQKALFTNRIRIASNSEKATRVLNGIKAKTKCMAKHAFLKSTAPLLHLT